MSLRTFTLTVTRTAQGHYRQGDGMWVEGAESTFTIVASVQPLRPREIELLPDERRTTEALRVYSDTPLRLAEQGSNLNADKVEIMGSNYEAYSCEPWQNNLLNHFKSIVLKI